LNPLAKYNRDCETSCTALAIDFSNYLDRLDQRLFDLVTPDYTIKHLLKLGGEPINFLDVAILKQRMATRTHTVRHLRSDIQITQTSETTAQSLSNCLAFFAKGNLLNGPLPMPKAPLPHVCEYHEDYIHTEAGWRLKARRTVEVFQDIPAAQIVALVKAQV
jgi:hypothetical protein